MNRLLSVIVPAYKQESTIAQDLLNIQSVLGQIRYDHEIICVIDGKVDQTFEEAQKVANERIKVVGYEKNRGKGYAIRFGMARARGDLIGFIDAGMDINPNSISMLLEHLEWYQADAIVGSKTHPASKVKYSLSRKILSKGYRYLVRFFTGLNVADTQTGLKVFKRQVLEDVLPRLVVKRFAFDFEMLAVAAYLGYRRIYEAPIELDYTLPTLSSAKTWQAIWNMLWDTAAVMYRMHILRYYDDKNSRRWVYDEDLQMRVNLP